MNEMPRFVKAQRDLAGRLAITFKGDDDKEFEKAFSDIRAGISWPIRDLKPFLAVFGLYSGAVLGNADSLMLVYEKEYSNALELMTDAYNRANDMRFQIFYTDRQRSDWQGFNYEFLRKLHTGLEARNIKLNHFSFAPDFMLGKETIKRFIEKKAIHIPRSSILMRQLLDFGPAQMKVEHPEYHFNAINAVRFVLGQWDLEHGRPQAKNSSEGGRKISVEGWA